MVSRKILLIIAGAVWMLAGINILRIGILAWISVIPEAGSVRLILLGGACALILAGFFFMFRKIVRKNTARIRSYGERTLFLKFMDLKGWLMMAFMMTLGIVLRSSGLLPDDFFAFFYTGLGTSLSIAGVMFLIAGLRTK
ncbi:MAG: hypothetical protein IJX93_10730 [Clostridia bacterium]|nr:hypothetical protein [Clostridia bacterium]MBQ8334233.1 hypothetical protein [Clostridia bacterium]MBQ8511957.1 hypothetical protein [Clostridia bacterium]